MTKIERIKLINQYLILESLYPEDKDYYSKLRTALERGYVLSYEKITENLDDEMTMEKCEEVYNILNMYRALNNSYCELIDKSGINPDDIKFKGFDGNDETEYLCYVEYLIETLGLYAESKGNTEFPDYNTHHNTLRKYRKMLEVWNGYNKSYKMNKIQIKNIVNE